MPPTTPAASAPATTSGVQRDVRPSLSAGSLRTVAPGERVALRAWGRCPRLDETTTVGRTTFEGVAAVYAFLGIQTKPDRGGLTASSAPVVLTVVKSTGEAPPGHWAR